MEMLFNFIITHCPLFKSGIPKKLYFVGITSPLPVYLWSISGNLLHITPYWGDLTLKSKSEKAGN